MAFFGAMANGDIHPNRFVKWDTTANRVLECGAGDKIAGISQKGTRNPPLSDGNWNVDDGLAAKAGGQLLVAGPGEHGMEVLLELGGTVTRGDRLKASTNGVGVSTTTNLDEWGAIALKSGVSGDLIPVQVVFPSQISS